MNRIRIGTCSWKYESWEGLVYSRRKGINHLEEYARSFDTVEIDQWFWSLFREDQVRLPNPSEAESYARSVPDGFRFTVKAPNSLTLTHFRRKGKADPLRPNPYFLSPELFGRFLDAVEPLREKLGLLMFQFEYLNREKMASREELQRRLAAFLTAPERRPRDASGGPALQRPDDGLPAEARGHPGEQQQPGGQQQA